MAPAAASLLAAGCTSDPNALSWRFDLAGGVAADDIRIVRARVLSGGCDSVDLRYEAFLSPVGGMAAQPPELGPGLFSFDGLATDGLCNIVAAGCVERSLPGSGVVTVELAGVAPPRALCAASACEDGICAGGIRDAGPELGPADLGPRDLGPVDLGPPDLGRDAGSPRIPIARVHNGFSIMGMTYLRVAFSARPESPGEPSGRPLDPEYFWALPPRASADAPCTAGHLPLGAFYAPNPEDARQVFYSPSGGAPSGYMAVPPFACVPSSSSPETIDIRQLSKPGAPAAEYYYTAQASEAAELVSMFGYDDDGVAFRGYRGP